MTLATFISLTIPSAAGANTLRDSAPDRSSVLGQGASPISGPRTAATGNRRVLRPPGPTCYSARNGLRFYVTRANHWLGKRGVRFLASSPSSTSCRYTLWLAKRWRSRSWQARQAYERFQERRYVLRDFEVTPGSSAWLRAVEQAQGPYPNTSWWLKSCSSTEGGWGRWVPNSDGAPPGGWMQFYESTFWRMWATAQADVRRRGFKVPASAASWYSPLGQALAGAWGLTNGRRHEWSSSGC